MSAHSALPSPEKHLAPLVKICFIRGTMKKALLILLFFTFVGTACGGRVPSHARAAEIAKKHFQKYGKKYKDSDFAQSAVSAVEVKGVKELQKDVATGMLLVKLDNGTEVPILMTFIRKVPGGWRTTSWEWVH